MRALFLELPGAILAERRAKGLDRWDEVWEGVLHVVPPPSIPHQEFVDDLKALLKAHVERYGLGRVIREPGVRVPDTDETNYRVPDLVFLSTDRLGRIGHQWIEGGPDIVFEVRSPGDESYDKLAFYAKVGVAAVVIIDPASAVLEVFRLAGSAYLAQSEDDQGWHTLSALQLRLKVDTAAKCLRIKEPGGSILGGISLN